MRQWRLTAAMCMACSDAWVASSSAVSLPSLASFQASFSAAAAAALASASSASLCFSLAWQQHAQHEAPQRDCFSVLQLNDSSARHGPWLAMTVRYPSHLTVRLA